MTALAASTHRPTGRLASVSLALHAAMLLGSGLAFATFLAPPTPAWLAAPANQHFAALMFRYGGQTTVVLGAIAGLAHAISRLGVRRALLIFTLGFSISLAAELTGTTTGYPFGPYGYTTQLGYLIGGRVPFNIPTSWFFMMYASLAICARMLSARDDAATKWRWALTAAFVLTAWDVSMDPAMVSTTHWLWHLPHDMQPSFTQRIFLSNLFYGMPLTNWLGWLLTGFVIARIMLEVVPPSAWKRDVAPTGLPLVLYAVNGAFPILICVGRQMWAAVVLGALAMLLPLALAMRRSHANMNMGTVAAAIAGD